MSYKCHVKPIITKLLVNYNFNLIWNSALGTNNDPKLTQEEKLILELSLEF